MEAPDIKKMRGLEDLKGRLKLMFADLSIEHRAVKDIIEKISKNSNKACAGHLFDRSVCHELTSDIQNIVAEQGVISRSVGYATE